MQYQVQDILRQRDYRAHNLLSVLLDACADVLETLADEACEAGDGLPAYQKTHR